ncbi:MAG: hypothetical protein IPM38_13240 [Ignavibacteria bacterium]|nr:hypothetical protein [Ignavibacteria bacterium]
MRTLIYFLLAVLIYSGDPQSVYSQSNYHWRAEKRLTENFFDTNPQFMRVNNPYHYTYNIETMIFERRMSGSDSVSRITIVKVDTGGLTGDPVYISSGEFEDTNPYLCIGNLFYTGLYDHAFAVWETKRISGSHIAGAFYSADIGWHEPFIIDSSADCHNPIAVATDSINYSVVFESSGEIIYKEIQARTGSVSYFYNLTSQDTSYCNAPQISDKIENVKKQVTYQRRNSNSSYSVLKRNLYNSNLWSEPEVIAGNGDNRNRGYILSYIEDEPSFESDFSGKWNIYSFFNNSLYTIPEANDSADNTSLVRFFNNRVTLNGFLYSDAIAYREHYLNQDRIIFKSLYLPKDTVMLNGNVGNTTMTINNGLFYRNYNFLIWVIYNKDSSGNSSLYGKSVQVYNTGISGSGDIIPEIFHCRKITPIPLIPILLSDIP